MDAVLYAKILSDKSITDLKKIKYKFPDVDLRCSCRPVMPES